MTHFRCAIIGVLCCFAVAAPAQEAGTDPCAKGQQFFKDDNYIAAEPFLRDCLAQGESLDALLPLTVITVLQERGAEGLELGARALAVAPDNARVRYWYGRALLVAGDDAAAVAQWEEGLRLDTSHAGILEGLARLSLQQGDEPRAYNLLLQMKMQGANEPWLHRMLSDLARRRGLWDRSAIHWGDLVAATQETEENLVILGELHILAGQADQALEVFRHAVATLPSGATWGGLGEAWFAAEQVDSAVVALRKAVALEPENPHHRFNLANALQIEGDLTGAEAQYVAFLEARPDHPVGHFKYGVHLELRGEADRALSEVERAVALDSRYVEALVVLAQMYELRGRVEETLSTIARLEQLDPGAGKELAEWRQRLETQRSTVADAVASGKVYLQHIIAADAGVADAVTAGLAGGEDFAALATRFSTGPTAARGGEIGWVDPGDMLPAMAQAIRRLQPGEVSPAIPVGGVSHFFRRVR